MIIARQGKEIVVEVLNKIGVLHDISKTISEKGINILAVLGIVSGENAVIRLVTDDILRTGDALRAKKYSPSEQEVVLVDLPHKPGMLRAITERLSKSAIDIHHIYGTATTEQDKSLVVFSSSNNEHAVVVLKSK